MQEITLIRSEKLLRNVLLMLKIYRMRIYSQEEEKKGKTKKGNV
jgi:hypothetical protein